MRVAHVRQPPRNTIAASTVWIAMVKLEEHNITNIRRGCLQARYKLSLHRGAVVGGGHRRAIGDESREFLRFYSQAEGRLIQVDKSSDHGAANWNRRRRRPSALIGGGAHRAGDRGRRSAGGDQRVAIGGWRSGAGGGDRRVAIGGWRRSAGGDRRVALGGGRSHGFSACGSPAPARRPRSPPPMSAAPDERRPR
jgi:hypothetical protein